MCDMRYADDNTIFGFGNRAFGIPLLNDGPNRLAKLIGLSKAVEFITLDRQINSEEAVDLGIVMGAVKDGTGTKLKTNTTSISFKILYNLLHRVLFYFLLSDIF